MHHRPACTYHHNGVRAAATEMDYPNTEEIEIKCSIKGCPGEYMAKAITHTVRHRGQVVVFDQVPAEVCDICGDTLLVDETVMKIEELLKSKAPAKSVSMYECV